VTITEGGERSAVPRWLRKHLFLSAFIVLALIGAGIRLLPTTIAAASGGSASTACSAKQ
jgi:hypothetical protein